MKKLLISALSLSVLLTGCGQEGKKEDTNKSDNVQSNKSEDAKKKIKKQKEEKVTTEKPTTEKPTTEIATTEVATTEISTSVSPSIESYERNKTHQIKTNENGKQILGYTELGNEIIGYTSDGTPIVDEMYKQPNNQPVVQPTEQEQAEYRKNIPGGLSSGERQMKYLIETGQYTEPDAQQRLQELNSLEQKYGN